MKKNYCIVNIFILFLLMLAMSSCESAAQRLERQEKERIIERAEKEREIGKAAFAKIGGKYGVLKDEKTTEYLNKLGKSLSMYTERQDIEYFFVILNSDQINAYALPGGYILVTRGLINSVPDLPTFIGVLSHELGHINLKHILKHVKIEVKYNFFELLARVIAGPRSVMTSLASAITDKVEEQLFINGLDADDEFEADKYAVRLMQCLNINAACYIDYIASMKENNSADVLENLDKTHPDVVLRTEHMKAVYNPKAAELKTSENFKAFKAKIAEISAQLDTEKEVKENE